mgnify:CR=1 FL=1
MMVPLPLDPRQTQTVPNIEDLKMAASKMKQVPRRLFQAEMALKYCGGSARKAEDMFGWGRANVQLGLHEKRTGITCLGTHSALGGRKLWEEKHPKVAAELFEIAELHSQQDPTFRSTLSYTRLTAAEALKQLRNRGFAEKELPCPRTMANILNRNGYKLRTVLKAKPQKKFLKQTVFSAISKIKMVKPSREERSNE